MGEEGREGEELGSIIILELEAQALGLGMLKGGGDHYERRYSCIYKRCMRKYERFIIVNIELHIKKYLRFGGNFSIKLC